MQLCGGKVSEGVFIGAFLSMSSTAVVSIYTSWFNLLFYYFSFVIPNYIVTWWWFTCQIVLEKVIVEHYSIVLTCIMGN